MNRMSLRLRKLIDRCAARLGYGRKAARTQVEHEPSEDFWDAITHAGSLVIDCEFCGRTHFAGLNGRGYYDDGEFEDLEHKAERSPDQYIGHYDCDSISFGTLNGKQAVYGCPCNEVRRYEDFIWHDRSLIQKYLRARAERELRRAEQNAEEAGVTG